MGLGEHPAAEAAAGVKGCKNCTRDRERMDAAANAAGREDHQPASAERAHKSGWERMAGPLSAEEGRPKAAEGGLVVASRRCRHRRADPHTKVREGRRQDRGHPNRRGSARSVVAAHSHCARHVGGRDLEGSKAAEMAEVARPLRHVQSRGAGDAHPAPRVAWEQEGG